MRIVAAVVLLKIRRSAHQPCRYVRCGQAETEVKPRCTTRNFQTHVSKVKRDLLSPSIPHDPIDLRSTEVGLKIV